MHHYGVFRRLLGCGAGEPEMSDMMITISMQIFEDMADRIEELEAKLAKAVLALQLIEQFTNTHDQRAVAIEMLAQLKGQGE